jgi:hypothetical protein
VTGARKWFVLVTVLSVVVLAAILVLPSEPEGESMTITDGPTYATTGELRSDSDLVIHGTIAEVVDRYLDSGGDPEGLPGLPKLTLRVNAAEILDGDKTSHVFVVTADTEGPLDDWNPDLEVGDEVVLYLFEVPAPADAPNMSPELIGQYERFGQLFGIVGGKQGVFDVVDGVATSRSEIADLALNDLATD